MRSSLHILEKLLIFLIFFNFLFYVEIQNRMVPELVTPNTRNRVANPPSQKCAKFSVGSSVCVCGGGELRGAQSVPCIQSTNSGGRGD